MGVLRLIALTALVLVLSAWGETSMRAPVRWQSRMIFGFPLDQKRIVDHSQISVPYTQGDAAWQRGAWYFDGNGDGVLTNFKTAYNLGTFTISFWAKLNTTANATFKAVVARQNTAANNSVWYILYDLTADSYSFYTSAVTGTDPYSSSHISVTDLNWHQIAYTYKAGEFRKYLDGRLVQSYAITFTPATSDKMVSVGNGDSGNTTANSWNGGLKFVYGWDRAFQPSEIWQLYSQQRNYVR